MFRFDHDASPQGVGGYRNGSGGLNHRFIPLLNERVAAPAIYWSRLGGMRAQVLAWNVRAR